MSDDETPKHQDGNRMLSAEEMRGINGPHPMADWKYTGPARKGRKWARDPAQPTALDFRDWINGASMNGSRQRKMQAWIAERAGTPEAEDLQRRRALKMAARHGR